MGRNLDALPARRKGLGQGGEARQVPRTAYLNRFGRPFAPTFQNRNTDIGLLGLYLQAQGCRTAGLLADNGIDWVIADLAALQSGTTLVPLPPYFSESQLGHVIEASSLDTLILDRASHERFPHGAFQRTSRDYGNLQKDLTQANGRPNGFGPFRSACEQRRNCRLRFQQHSMKTDPQSEQSQSNSRGMACFDLLIQLS